MTIPKITHLKKDNSETDLDGQPCPVNHVRSTMSGQPGPVNQVQSTRSGANPSITSARQGQTCIFGVICPSSSVVRRPSVVKTVMRQWSSSSIIRPVVSSSVVSRSSSVVQATQSHVKTNLTWQRFMIDVKTILIR